MLLGVSEGGQARTREERPRRKCGEQERQEEAGVKLET